MKTTIRKIRLLLVAAFAAISFCAKAQTGDCLLKTPYWEKVSGSYYPTFERTSCKRNVTIHYKVYFADGTSDQSRFVYILSSSFTTKVRGTSYKQNGRIQILKTEWEDGEDNSEISSTSQK
jgi:hypothetical protein